MKMIAVDDEPKALSSFLRVLEEVRPGAEVTAFTDAQAAFDHLGENPVDVAFLDIEMGGLTGLELAEKCKSLCPRVNIIFVTAYSQYSLEALRLHASGYLLKPVRVSDLRGELENLRHNPLPPPKEGVRVQAFGNFSVFVGGEPLSIPLAKCRECLAYLIDRKGAFITTAELSAVLWEDRPYNKTVQNNTHRVVSDLMKLLRMAGADNILLKTSREIAVDIHKVDCDYYGFLQGNDAQIKAFRGEYMTNYSWAEYTLAELLRTKKDSGE